MTTPATSQWTYVRLYPEQIEILLESIDLAASVSAYPLEALTALTDAIHAGVVEDLEPTSVVLQSDPNFVVTSAPDPEVLEVAGMDPYLLPPANRMPEWSIFTCTEDGKAFFYPKVRGKPPQMCLSCIVNPQVVNGRLAVIRKGIEELGRPYIRVRTAGQRFR